MKETYGSTQMRAQPEHVVYVSVGSERRQRFGENKVGKIAMGVLGMTLVACLVYSAATEERRYSAYTPSVGLAQRKVMQGDIRKMEMQLAAKEVHHKLMVEATMGLSPEVKKVAHTLVHTPKTSMLQAVDCSKMDAYKLLQGAFETLSLNITAENATIHAHDAALEKAYTEAKDAWMASESAFRSAESAHGSAASAATYAKGQYDLFSSAVEAGQSEWDTTVPGLNSESAELTAQLPILQQVKELVENMASSSAAKGKVQRLKQLPLLKKLANAVVPPRFSKDKQMAKKVLALRTSLAETATGSTVSGMVTILDEIVSTMTSRIAEIATTITSMQTALDTNKVSETQWETSLVTLSDDKDKAENAMNTADLQRQELNGEHIVKEEAYNDYHAGFVDEAAKFARQLKALETIGAKIDDAIGTCAAGAAA
jgi:hypothetical protein